MGDWTPEQVKELSERESASDRRFNLLLSGAIVTVAALGWNEIQRRLITLNHAHEQQVATLAATVSSDKYESDKSQLAVRVAGIESRQLTSDTKSQAAAEEAARLSGARGENVATGFSVGAAKRQGYALVVSLVALGTSVVVVVASFFR